MNRPRSTPVCGPKDSSSFCSTGAKPDAAISVDHQARPAGCERTFTLHDGRRRVARLLLPTCTSVIGSEDQKTPVDGVCECDPMIGIPEGDGVEKALGIAILERESPRLSSVGRPVDARFVAIADREEMSPLFIERVNVAKVEVRGARHDANAPGLTAVRGAQQRPFRSTRPHDLGVDDAEPPQPCIGAACLRQPLRL